MEQSLTNSSQYTTQLSVDSTPQLVLPQPSSPNNLVPVQIILVIKAKNQKKINSHRWLFNAIGKTLEVGTWTLAHSRRQTFLPKARSLCPP